jgi:hypothetical protein
MYAIFSAMTRPWRIEFEGVYYHIPVYTRASLITPVFYRQTQADAVFDVVVDDASNSSSVKP